MKHLKKIMNMISKKMKKKDRKRLIVLVAIALILSFLMTTYNYLASSRIDYMIVTLNYEGAKKGLNPDGSRFKINEIKSEQVLKEAINLLGDTSLSVDSVKGRISIDSKMPLSAIEKTSAAIASGSTYSYNPSEFDVYYSQKSKFGKNNTAKFLHALSKSYSEYFFTKYSEKNTVLMFDATEDLEEYDYYETKRVLFDKVNSMISYLGKHQEEAPTYRSAETGYTFENIVNSLINLRDYDLEKLEAFVVQNQISKDKPGFVRKQAFMADKYQLNFQSYLESSEIVKQALELYDPHITGIAFIPSVDGHDEYYMSRTKTGLDNLAVKSYNQGITANGFKEKIDSYNYLTSKFSSEEENEGNASQKADAMIEKICTHLESISSIALMTDDEYVSSKTRDYITFKLPEDGLKIPIAGFAVNFIIICAAFIIIHRVYIFAVAFAKKKEITQKVIDKLKSVAEEE